jgi:GPI ethanolamine phosphate transferase 2/3 subunit F
MASVKQEKAGAASNTTVTQKGPSSPLHPIALHDDATAKLLANARPAALGALLLLGFGPLVADPETALQYSLPLVAAVQVAYAVICLPVAGAQHTKSGKKSRPGEKKKTDASGPNPVVVSRPMELQVGVVCLQVKD